MADISKIIGTRVAHYQILQYLGEGGMGVVFKARDSRLDRFVAIKFLLKEDARDPSSKRRFIQEAKAASALNHPNIVTVHDIDSDQGHDFIVMEYVAGKTLGRIIPRKGIPLNQALKYAIQIADALARAHAAGIIHRDVKPANIIVDDHGLVKILDFGLAKLTEKPVTLDATTVAEPMTGEGMLLGTAGYMSPEQAEGKPVDARTDIFSFGDVLYEMVTGQKAFQRDSMLATLAAILRDEPPQPSEVTEGIPHAVERVITMCLRKDPDRRWQSMLDVRNALEELKEESDSGRLLEKEHPPRTISQVAGVEAAAAQAASDGQEAQIESDVKLPEPTVHPRRRRWTMLAAGGLVLTLLAVAVGLYISRRHIVPLTDRDTIVLAEFANTTGDPVFDSTLNQGLAVQLEQSPFLSILPDARVRQTLRLMNRPSDERVTRDVARDIALRQGVKAYITGSIAPLGSSYVIGLEAVNAQTGDVIARAQTQSSTKEEVLKRLGELASALRRGLGESLNSIQKFDAQLEATTSSLQALKAYATGYEASSRGKYMEAIPRLKTSIELDPNFSLAYQALAVAYRNTGQPQLSRQYAEKAFALCDRVTELERLRITYLYHRTVTGELDRALETLERLREAYPRDLAAAANIATVCLLLGQPQEAAKAAQEAIRLGSPTAANRANLSYALIQLNRFAEAKEVAETALRQGLEHTLLRTALFYIAYMNRDDPAMKRLLVEAEKMPNGRIGFDWQASTAALEGKLRRSRELSARSVSMSEASSNPELALLSSAEAARNSALLGDCAPARSLHPSAMLTDSTIDVIESAASALAMCGSEAAGTIAAEASRRYPKSTLLNRATLPLIYGTLALQRGNAQETIEVLEPARRYAFSAGFGSPYLRGLAYLRLKSGNLAAAEFQWILDHRGVDVLSPYYPLAYLGLARAAVLEGDKAKAIKAYQDILTLWKDADSDLAPLRAAKQEYQKLQN